jgi:ribonuclease D
MPTQLPPPILVQNARELERMLADLEGQSEIAVDTEADSFFNFREKVCLVQITVEERDYLLDPLAGFDISAFGRVLADPRREKIFHDGEYDILILKRNYGFAFAGLFDTRVAAAALGDPNPGLASVLKTRFGLELDKSLQRSNWSARPLSREQIEYARLDTRFLIPLARWQKQELERLGRACVVDGECRRLEQIVPAESVFNPDEYLRLNGARTLSLSEQRALRELFVLRNRLAEESDLPPFKVLGNQTLVDLARSQPRTSRDLQRVPGFSPRQARKLGDEVLATLERARELGPLERAPILVSRDGTGALDDDEFELHERLKEWRRDRAQREGYDASLVLNRHVLLRIAKSKPTTEESLRAIEGLLDWQREAFGGELLGVVGRSLREFSAGSTPRSKRRGFNRRRD